MSNTSKYVYIEEPTGTRRWRVVRRKLPQNQHETNWGSCDHEKRLIELHTTLSARELLATLAHEAIHAACPDLSENAVCRIETAVLNTVWPFVEEIADDMEGES